MRVLLQSGFAQRESIVCVFPHAFHPLNTNSNFKTLAFLLTDSQTQTPGHNKSDFKVKPINTGGYSFKSNTPPRNKKNKRNTTLDLYDVSFFVGVNEAFPAGPHDRGTP